MSNSVDFISDLHSCFEELSILHHALGYRVFGLDNHLEHDNCERMIVYLGDLFDRGPDPCGIADVVMANCKNGVAKCVLGNHDSKLLRYFRQKQSGESIRVKVSHGLSKTIEAMEERGSEYVLKILEFLESLPSVIETPDWIAVHAGYKENLKTKEAKEVHLYGDVDREAGYDSGGFPLKLNDWKSAYMGTKTIVHGHIVVDTPEIRTTPGGGRVISIDTGGCFGGSLTSYSWPEHYFTSVPARQIYWERKKMSDA